MNKSRGPLYAGAGLILAGILFLLAQFGYGNAAQAAFGAMFLVGGILFFAGFTRQPARWGLLFPAVVLGAIGAGSFLDAFAAGSDLWIGPLMLGGLGMPFVAGYAITHRWGLLIPAGVLVSLGFTALAGVLGAGPYSGAILFAGMGLTFGLLPRAAPAGQVGSWAYIVGVSCAVLAGIVLTAAMSQAGVVWAVLLIGAGVALLAGSMRRHPA